MTGRRLTFAIFAASLLVLSPLAFQSKWPLVFYRFDGTFLLILAAMQKVWALGGWNFTSNPLQGIGGLELPQHTILLDPGLWLAVSLPPWLGPTAAMTFYAGYSRSRSVGSARAWGSTRSPASLRPGSHCCWHFPTSIPRLGFEFLWGVPAYVPLIVLDMAAFLLLLDLGKGSRIGTIGTIFRHCWNMCVSTDPISRTSRRYPASCWPFSVSLPSSWQHRCASA